MKQFQRLLVSSERNLNNRLKKGLLMKNLPSIIGCFHVYHRFAFRCAERKLKIHVSWSIFWNFLFEARCETAQKALVMNLGFFIDSFWGLRWKFVYVLKTVSSKKRFIFDWFKSFQHLLLFFIFLMEISADKASKF